MTQPRSSIELRVNPPFIVDAKPRSKFLAPPRLMACARCSTEFMRMVPSQKHCSDKCRLLAGIKVMPSGCWEWQGSLVKGYGCIRMQGTWEYTHRLAWVITRGPIPDGPPPHGTIVMHACDNRRCCNPDHLRLGTHSENMADMARKGRAGNLGRTMPAWQRKKISATKLASFVALKAGLPWPPPKPPRLTAKQTQQKRLKGMSAADLERAANELLFGKGSAPRSDYVRPKLTRPSLLCAKCDRPRHIHSKKICRACFCANARKRRDADMPPAELPEFGWEGGAPVPIHRDELDEDRA